MSEKKTIRIEDLWLAAKERQKLIKSDTPGGYMTSFWRYNDVIIVSHVRCGIFSKAWEYRDQQF